MIQKMLMGMATGALEKFKNTADLDDDGRLDIDQQIIPALELGTEAIQGLVESVHVPTVLEAVEHAKVAVEALQRSVNQERAKESLEDLQEAGGEIANYVKGVLAKRAAG